ncbi:esterase/lipase family protein [Aspergillus affinis]|uniref:esterase/lipase family protein n=1 Tax=Aspergillus affinis TaxID=1070780 RepID=UPI0022FE7AAF|nr:secreted lipase [Aspergillus affinis]KAI9035995.1 secreted lipase [Aspergillus affinis]
MHLRSLLLGSAVASSTLAFGINDFSCRSEKHPNPVVLLHGLGATFYEDLNFLQYWLQAQGYCTFAQTYGDYDGFPFLGGLKAIAESATEIADYIHEVAEKTGAEKIDLVGHSEGAFQTLYVPKFEEGTSELLDKLVAIAPPTRGTNFANIYNLAYAFGNASREAVSEVLHKVGCAACDDLGPDGAAIDKLNDGQPIVQAGNKLTVIASKLDELVTPQSTSFVHESGVNNVWVQNKCKFDPVGHIGEAYDLNVWNLVKNALDDTPDRNFICVLGSPGK